MNQGPRAPGPPSSGATGKFLFLGKTLRKIIKNCCHQMTDFKAKCIKFDFSWGSAPDPAGGAYSAPPDSLAGFGGRFATGGGARLGKRRGSGGEGKGGPHTAEPGPLRALLRHWVASRGTNRIVTLLHVVLLVSEGVSTFIR